MPRSLEEVRQIAYELPEDQRILLAESLFNSVESSEDEASEAEIDAAWDPEIKRRLDEIDSGAVEMIPLEGVLARMDARIQAKRRE
jgi:putative addiction module component (TIGR02574 family)